MDDKYSDLITINKIRLLNNAKLGSLSEFIFERSFNDKTLRRTHFGRTDFKWNESFIDIKGRRKVDYIFRYPTKYYGKTYGKTRYILVEFYQDCVVISEYKNVIKVLPYISINEIYEEWVFNRSNSNYIKKDTKQLDKIKEEITSHFNKKGYKVRIIYRTTQNSFGEESPDNLLPNKILNNQMTVFINFYNNEFSRENIKEIIAFQDCETEIFKRISNPRLHKDKIDLCLLDNKYKFKSIEELIKC